MNKIANRNSENGFAVIFTLGILGLVIISAIVLVSSASLERKSTSNYNSLQLSRIAAHSALQRAVFAIQLYSSDMSFDPANFYSYDANSGSASDSTPYTEGLGGVSGLLADTVNGTSSYYVDYTSTPLPNAPVWQYIKSNVDGDTAIIARYAYKVFSTTGLFDPSACIDSGYNANVLGLSAVSEDGTEYTSLGPDGNYVFGRPGRNVNEIFIGCMDDSAQWVNNSGRNYVQKISSKWASTAGNLVGGDGLNWIGRWSDFETLSKGISINSSQSDTFRKYFIFGESPDPEAYWSNSGTDSTKICSELYHRFNLARTDWSSVTVDSIVSASPRVYNSADAPYDGDAIPWIANWTMAASDTCWTSDSMRRQIAANLIDFCDADSTATTDSTDTPTYVGNDSCPYINEVRVRVQAIVTVTAGGSSSTRRYTCTMKIMSTDVEAVDMYGSNVQTTADVSISGQFRWVLGSSNPYSTGTFTNKTFSVSIPSVSKSCQYGTYSTVIDISPTSNNPSSSSTSRGLATSITNFILTSLKIKLKNTSTGAFYDYSYVVNSSVNSPAYTVLSSVTTSTGTSYPYTYTGDLYLDFQIPDPRQNLYPTDWSNGVPTATGTASTVGSLNNTNADSARNTVFSPPSSIDADSESGITQPWQMSTAYIRNSPMKSPWELGLVHRGTKWQTLNLKKFYPGRGVNNAVSNGGSAYSSGDANILDQVKMSSDCVSYGKVNVNSKMDSAVLKAIFEKIRVGSNMAGGGDPATSSTSFTTSTTNSLSIDNTRATALADAMKASSTANTGGMAYSRAEILSSALTQNRVFWNNTLFSSPDNIQTRDAQQEEIIGKFINLTKAERSDDIYTVIAVAQSLKDVSDSALSSHTGSYDTGKDKIISTQKIKAVLKRDPGSNKVIIQSFKY